MKNKLTSTKPSKKVEVVSAVPFDDSKYRAEDGLRTILRAEEIKRDKNLMKDIKQLAKKQSSDLKKVC